MSDIERAERAEAALQRVRELHQEVTCDGGCLFGSGADNEAWGVSGNHCSECSLERWPCPTIEAIDGPQ